MGKYFKSEIYQNNRGMSIAGALAGLALLSIVIAGVMTVSQNMLNTARTADVKAAVQDEIFLAQAIFATETNCTSNFRGLPIDTTTRAFESHAGKLFLASAPNVYTLGTSYIFPSQDPQVSSSLIRLTKIQYNLHPGTNNVMKLGLQFEPRGSIIGGTLRTREIPLKVKVVGNRIESCSSLLGQSEPVDDPGFSASQGRACNSSPPQGPSQANLKSAIESICDLQSYPVTTGLQIPKSEIRKCIRGFGAGGKCQALLGIAFSETTDGFESEVNKNRGNNLWTFDRDVTLKNRNGYSSKADCIQQKNFSEGDSYRVEVPTGEIRNCGQHGDSSCGEYTVSRHFTCINGRWAN